MEKNEEFRELMNRLAKRAAEVTQHRRDNFNLWYQPKPDSYDDEGTGLEPDGSREKAANATLCEELEAD